MIVEWYWIVAIIYGVLWVVAISGIAACMLSSRISQQEERAATNGDKVMGTDIGYYQLGQKVELTWRESVQGEGVFSRTDSGTIVEITSNACRYIFIYIETENNGEKMQNIGRINKVHGRVKLL